MRRYDMRTNSATALVLPTVRGATTADRCGLVAMLDRCSGETLVHRFGGCLHEWPEPFLTDCLSRPADQHDALVAMAPDSRRVTGLATAARLGDGAADISLIVEDAWQHLGLGPHLLDVLLARAAARGVRRLSFQVAADQAWLLALSRRHLRVTDCRWETGVILVEGLLDQQAGEGNRVSA